MTLTVGHGLDLMGQSERNNRSKLKVFIDVRICNDHICVTE